MECFASLCGRGLRFASRGLWVWGLVNRISSFAFQINRTIESLQAFYSGDYNAKALPDLELIDADANSK